jgi:hypothetical protein
LSEFPSFGFINPANTFNYLPGYAAFASAFVAGFCGVRVRDFQIDIVYPTEYFGNYQNPVITGQSSLFKRPTANTESWNVTGMNYRGSKLDLVYDMRSRSVTIRNRRSNEPGSGQGDDTLEVMVYEGNEPVIKPLKVGDTVILNLATETWQYNSKRNRLMRSDIYANNMHILASIYSISYSKNLVRQSNGSPETHSLTVVFALVCGLVYHKMVKFVSF